MRSKFLTTKLSSKSRVAPKAFTEKGLYMLATILKSKRAVAATFAIIETFAKVRGLKRPTDTKRTPHVLLGTVQRDPELTLLAKPGKHAIASCYFDEDGRATTMVAYVRIFLRDLEASGLSLPDDEIACLTDSGWCRKNLKLHHAMLRETSEPMTPVSGYWKEMFKFGNRIFLVSDGWTVKSKLHFDQWASRIAAIINIKFTPYELGVIQTEE